MEKRNYNIEKNNKWEKFRKNKQKVIDEYIKAKRSKLWCESVIKEIKLIRCLKAIILKMKQAKYIVRII